MLKDDALLERIDVDWRSAGLDRRRIAMLEYSAKLTLTPGQMEKSDIEQLRAAGFSDRDILDVCEVVSYYAYVNRIADGLGVTLETWIDE